MGIWNSVKGRLDEYEERKQEWVESTLDFDDEQLVQVIKTAKGDSVNRDTLLRPVAGGTAPFNLLDKEEQPQYFLNGSTIDVEGQGAGTETIIGWDRDRRIGSAYTVITDDRLLIIANHARGYDEHTIPYDGITTVNLNNGLTSTRLSVQTTSATYHCSVSKSKRKYGKDEVEKAVTFLRKRRGRGDEAHSSEDPLDRLEKLKSLYDEGVITDEEFEEKRATLLDEV